MSDNEIVVYQQPGALLRRDPKQVLAEAGEAARALKEVIEQPGRKKLVLGGETYLEIQDWTTVGHFYGLVPSLVEDRFVEYGGAYGFEATAALRRISDGAEVSRATAMCLNDEENWGARPKYEWHYVTRTMGIQREDPGREELVWEEGPGGKRRPKKVRVHVGDEQVPLHQLRSMAQTRANAKVLANVLRYVPVLAGYKGTPAEEMSGARWEPEHEENGAGAPPPADQAQQQAQEPRQRRQRKPKDEPAPQESAPSAQQAPQGTPPAVGTRTREEYFEILREARKSGLDDKSVEHHLGLVYGNRKFSQLTDAEAAEFLAWAKGPRAADRGFEADHFVSPDRLPAGVKATPPATLEQVLQQHGIGQGAAQQAIDVQSVVISDEVARQVRNLGKWAENASRSIDHVRGACMSAFGFGLEVTLSRYKAAYSVLMEWAAEDDPAVNRDAILERAAQDIIEGRTPA